MSAKRTTEHLFSFYTPGTVLRSLAGNAALAVRKPKLFAGLLLAGLRSKKGFVRLLRLPIDLDTIRRSPLFDRDWYVRNHPELARSRLAPELHYLLHEVPDGRWASAAFSGDAYLELNPEVRTSGVNPLVHYEQYGRFIGCPASVLDAAPADPVFPAEARNLDVLLGEAPRTARRTAVYATFSADGRIAEKDLIYLRGLREVCDNVVFAANSPLLPGEEDKLRGLASAAVCRFHGGYDFGSYRLGLRTARERGWLAPDACRELVFANSSCYAPVRPFAHMFRAMDRRRRADFWGLTFNTQRSGKPHLQSFFLVFRRPVLDGGALEAFFSERPERATRREAIDLFEIQLTGFLRGHGFVPDAFVRPLFPRLHEFNPTTRPLDLIRRHKSPLVKVKVFSGESRQPPARVLRLVARLAPELAAVIRLGEPPRPRALSREDAVRARDVLAARIGEKVRAGRPARVLFPVSSSAMFPARPLFEAMRNDPAFDARISVIPDLRWPDRPPETAMEACERELGTAFPGALLSPLRRGADGLWPDVLPGFDFAVFPSPYEFSDFRYNPSRADAAGVLGLHVNYGFYRSVYDRSILALESYARFWKVFLECDATAAEFRAHAAAGGANGEVVGYVKMDALAAAAPWPRNANRKRVLVAPHHSVDGGANDTLALSNFQRYADYFLAMPEKHPELDFVFRPHPFLFTVLSHPSKWGTKKVADWIARMKAHPNVRWSDEGDYFPAFASCDACVQDCGSYLVEWVYTGKPCCYMLKDPADIDAKFAPLGKDGLSHCYLAYDDAAIESFLRDVVEGGNDPKAAAREAFRKTVMVNYPHAAAAALASIKRALGMA
ncbi:MAG: hypothetical protein II839_00330 [Kiritimatiellae bacterium]|nr:hypothetical protein [Kiritimatiellia bacterium]